MACYRAFLDNKVAEPPRVLSTPRTQRTDESFFSRAPGNSNDRFNRFMFLVPGTSARASVPFARATPKKRSGTHFAMNNDVAELSLAVIMPGLAAFVDQPSIHLVIRLVDDH